MIYIKTQSNGLNKQSDTEMLSDSYNLILWEGGRVRSSIRPSVRAWEHGRVRSSVRPSAHGNVGAWTRGSVHPSVRSSLYPSARRSVGAWAGGLVRSSVRPRVEA